MAKFSSSSAFSIISDRRLCFCHCCCKNSVPWEGNSILSLLGISRYSSSPILTIPQPKGSFTQYPMISPPFSKLVDGCGVSLSPAPKQYESIKWIQSTTGRPVKSNQFWINIAYRNQSPGQKKGWILIINTKIKRHLVQKEVDLFVLHEFRGA